ncbi:MAG: UDP-N-acetylmuramoyl-L-alanyl-D-glutamate--2,6-diaminopimelate ligase [Candidatus Omnitrophica bacterium]|nr:UDP-N-acetylmuramoyl-L-alanyl-D-glutamate--2,6-diaminopimelate ligase [Candidatus Omnitrophota bacterium]
MKIKDILQGLECSFPAPGVAEQSIDGISFHSGEVRPGMLFVAVRGEGRDGHHFIPEALERGASACLADETMRRELAPSPAMIFTPNTRAIAGLLASRAFQNPSREVALLGVTGTNGKTTTSFLIHHIFNQFSGCGLIGTVYHQVGRERLPSGNTTPGPMELHRMLFEMKQAGQKYCSLEVSSHALAQDRVAGIGFRSAVFTNLTQDHLDYHRTFENYFEAKKKLFTQEPRPLRALVNIDDAYGKRLHGLLDPKPLTFGLEEGADFRALEVEARLDRVSFLVRGRGFEIPVRADLACLHNVYNILGAFACAVAEGWDPEAVARSLESFPGVPGRMEKVPHGRDFLVFVDYAHTPDAFENVLGSVKRLSRGKILTVFGCGGDRDAAKRPLMGGLAERFSDRVILTSDNPRGEDPAKILDDIEAGIPAGRNGKVSRVPDREEAIARAVAEAGSGDVVLILGKGHEDYHILGPRKIHFDDRECARKILAGGR